jgi:hypothetical protein
VCDISGAGTTTSEVINVRCDVEIDNGTDIELIINMLQI